MSLGNKRNCYHPLDVAEWESMHIEAEIAFLSPPEDREDVIKTMANSVFRMSEEIRRLRHKCGEDVWYGVSTTQEQDVQERDICAKT